MRHGPWIDAYFTYGNLKSLYSNRDNYVDIVMIPSSVFHPSKLTEKVRRRDQKYLDKFTFWASTSLDSMVVKIGFYCNLASTTKVERLCTIP